MTLCSICTNETKSVCGGCKVKGYCSAECQRKDWPTHKLECSGRTSKKPKPAKAPNKSSSNRPAGPEGITMIKDGVMVTLPQLALPASLSPFGVIVDAAGVMVPASSHTIFFDAERLGYTPATVDNVYAELIEVYKYRRRHLASKEGKSEEEAMPDLEDELENFRDYWERVKASRILPKWWVEEVNGPQVMKLVTTYESYHIMKPCNLQRGLGTLSARGIPMRFGSMSERIYGGWEN